MSNFNERFKLLSDKVIGSDKLDYKDDNVLKRILYAEAELLKLDILEVQFKYFAKYDIF